MRILIPISMVLILVSACAQQKREEETEVESKELEDFSHIDIQGHRGFRALYPENSVLGALKALEAGANTIECDLAVSRDSVLVLSHEPWLNQKICLTAEGEVPPEPGENNNLFSMSLEEIAACDCGSLPREDFPDYKPVPHSKEPLDDLFQALIDYSEKTGKDVRLNIEIKSKPEWDGIFTPDIKSFSDLLLELIDLHGLAHQTTIQSFDPRPLNYIHEKRPEMSLSFLVWDPMVPIEKQLEQLDFKPDILSPDYRLVDEQLITYASEQQMQIIPWTVNDSLEVLSLDRLGVDGIISDDPSMVVKTLR